MRECFPMVAEGELVAPLFKRIDFKNIDNGPVLKTPPITKREELKPVDENSQAAENSETK